MREQLSIDHARKLVLHSQRLPPMQQGGTAIQATLSAIEHLGYVQIDTITAVQRAHHHTLWNRNPRYQTDQLDQLVDQKRVFEYWSHAAAYLPMRDFRHSLITKQRISDGDQQDWYVRDEKLMKSVLERITIEGPLMAGDFKGSSRETVKKPGDWSSTPAKRALETLFMMGKLMISGRRSFHKIYDLTERVLPVGVDTSIPTPTEHARFLIKRFLESNGLGQPKEIAYLRKSVKPLILSCLKEMVVSGEVREIRVGDQVYFSLQDSLALINKPLARSKLKILSPFDNLLIQRKRAQMLFGFDYLIECYIPKSKRQYGYFSLPILWDGNLVARMDCKADRRQSVLNIHHLSLEPNLDKHDAFCNALQKELVVFAKFNGCNSLQLHRTSPAKLKSPLRRRLRDLSS